MRIRCAGVRIIDMPYKADMTYSYFVPVTMWDSIYRGRIVSVPFGNGNRRMAGIITEVVSESSDNVLSKNFSKRSGGSEKDRSEDEKSPKSHDGKKEIGLKPIMSVFPEQCSLSDGILSVCEYISRITLSPLGDVIRAAVPSELLENKEIYYSVGTKMMSPDNCSDLRMLSVYSYIRNNGGAYERSLWLKFGDEVSEMLEKLERSGYITGSIEIKSKVGKQVRYARLNLSPDKLEALRNGTLKLRSKNQIRFLEVLDRGGGLMKVSDIYDADKSLSCSQLDSLVKSGAVITETESVMRVPFAQSVGQVKRPEFILNEGQSSAYEKLCELFLSEEAKAALLLGVTGSGKTAVIIKTIDRVISEGKGVIVLLPEIALTPQMTGLFRSYYGERVAVMHSGLSSGERFDTYNCIKQGKADIVIGTRSAVFAPVKNLGMVIIDEEQEHTYKSDISPKYHARDVARFRCADSKALMVLMSATPSLESYYKAVSGKYALIMLTERYGDAVLPEVTVADMRKEFSAGNITPLGHELINGLCENKSRGEQSVLFINRRGYHNFMSCKSCGAAVVCPSCSVSMTYHKDRSGNGYLCCHWCGHREPVPSKCPECGSEHLAFTGYGTQHIEEDLEKLLPGVRILRMDTDTTGSKQSYYDILGKFRDHEADILLGTQMVTKGHDFPDVTLVGVLLADMSLYLDDYRASERTFSMLTQVIGRAGRSGKRGRAVIQTNNPDNEIIQLAKAQDYLTFAENELNLRRQLVFPPYCDIALLNVVGGNETEVTKCVTQVRKKIEQLLSEKYTDVKTVMFGPFEAPVYRVKEQYRMRIVIKCRLNNRSRELFGELLRLYGGNARGPALTVDFNPSNL